MELKDRSSFAKSYFAPSKTSNDVNETTENVSEVKPATKPIEKSSTKQIVETAPQKEALEERIFKTISESKFEKWYSKVFMSFIEGKDEAKNKDEIMTDIISLFDI